MNKGVHIVECLDDADPGSEGRCLRHLFDLMEIESSYVRVNSITELLRTLEESEFRYVHISTHGTVAEECGSFRGWWTQQGWGKKSIVSKLRGKLKCELMVSTACKSGVKGFGSYVVNELGSRYFIGPKGSPSFPNAVLFSHLFYHKLFITKRSIENAFLSYEENYKNPHRFRLFGE